MRYERLQRFEQAANNINETSQQLEHDGFRLKYFPAEETLLSKAIHDWELSGWEVKRFSPEQESIARTIHSGPRPPRQVVPVYVRRRSAPPTKQSHSGAENPPGSNLS